MRPTDRAMTPCLSANGSITADGDGDPIAKRLTLSADGMAEYLIQHLLMGESF